MKTAELKLATDEFSLGHVVLLGNPCVAVTGLQVFSKEYQPEGNLPSPARPVGIWSCETGQHLADVAPAGAAKGELFGLTALPGCGLVVAQYAFGFAVINIKTRMLVPGLSGLFAGLQTELPKSLQRVGKRAWATTRYLMLVPSPVDDSCLVYGVAQEYKERAKAVVPAKIYEFDLKLGSRRLVRSLSYDVSFEGASIGSEVRAAISPSRRRVALSVIRSNGLPSFASGPRGVAELVFSDFGMGAKETRFDVRRFHGDIWGMSFLDEDTLFLATRFAIYNTDAQLFERRSGRVHTLCSTVFGEPNVKRGNVRALAVNARRRLIAIAMQSEVRVYRYFPNTGARWRGVRDCVND
ncbi:MAG: hypothetical protein K8S25_01430 [Alphaproteobacteria bacterium]|nr:hypothetical protein [Alphaproteobacteria bacterium]